MAPMFLAAAILLLQGGNCVSLLFADQQANDCCTRGECNPARKADPCCQTSPSAGIKYFQPESKSSTITLSSIPTPVTLNFGFLPPPSDVEAGRLPEAPFHSPPDRNAQASLPLLI